MYSKISQGSNVFWQEIENLLIVKSASFKGDSSNALLNVITSFSMQGRQNETFWKVFTNIFIESDQDLNGQIKIMKCYAELGKKSGTGKSIFKQY